MKKFITIFSEKSVQSAIIWSYAFCLLFLEIFLSWDTFATPFRRTFMYNLYYHSQWVMPEHIQSIGDDGLYQVAGDQYLKKHNFYEINPEVPPLGKYYYGLSIKYLGSAERGALALFLISILLFVLLLKKYVKDTVLQGFSVLFYITDPLLFYQATVSMLDLPQLVALLGHILAIVHLTSNDNKKSQVFFSILAGMTLGMFVSIKIALLGGVIVIADLFMLWRSKKLLYIFPILGLMGLTYLVTYTMYFVQGNSILDWLKAQKWMLNFYATSTIKPVFGTVFPTLLIGRIIGWDEGATWSRVQEWTILWTVYIVGTGVFVGKNITMIFKKEQLPELYLLLLSLGFLSAFAILPFFARYLVILLPSLVILTLHFIEKYNHSGRSYALILFLFLIQFFIFL